MITILVAAVTMQSPANTAPGSASELISRMLARYDGAQCVVGTIAMSQEAKGAVVTTETDLQYQRPNKIYLRQEEHSSQGRSFLLTSDGKTFSYDSPPDYPGRHKRFEEFTYNQYKQLDLGEMYTATLNSIVDPNHLLNIAIGRKGDLERFAAQLSDYRLVASQKVGDEMIYEIIGKYALFPNSAPSADFDMYITSAGDFRKFSIRQLYGVPKHPEMAPIPVTTTWVSTLQINGKPNDSLFKVVK